MAPTKPKADDEKKKEKTPKKRAAKSAKKAPAIEVGASLASLDPPVDAGETYDEDVEALAAAVENPEGTTRRNGSVWAVQQRTGWFERYDKLVDFKREYGDTM